MDNPFLPIEDLQKIKMCNIVPSFGKKEEDF
jgi:hypothetical protein